ncbi:acyltransferase family protein [Glaciecola petra]|uniref:DUF5009 domain-containing protein n=1 Tax=Glaciecola petra TaxID=3075602 RepID=A0ABU2ZRV0_9ALTE|nr:DUF5009 domain-containing protein [Aestuariibacter sp. P117]MDT0595368.1 DUF5009 domain-containing protein [Aestuariibacter sp. P117]
MRAHISKILEQYLQMNGSPQHHSKRLMAIDVFRGLTITAMILVNNPGSWSYQYWPLAHAHWHGWTPTDLIFPFFLFIVGWSLYASKLASANGAIDSKGVLFGALKRTFILFSLGLFLAVFYININDANFSWFNDRLLSIRIMGVLQRIALVYFVVIFIVMYCRFWTQVFIAIALTIAYLIALYFVPYADAAGVLYQGELARGFTFIDYLDSKILTPTHMYLGNLQPFASDPEGIFSTLPAIVTCLSGVWVAMWMKRTHLTTLFCAKLCGLGILLVVGATYFSSLIPINKPMWTPTYVMLSSGFACMVLSVLVYLIEIKKHHKSFAPFIVFGINSIAFFMFAGVVGRLLLMIPVGDSHLKGWFYSNFLDAYLDNYLASFIYSLCFLLISYLAMLFLYRHKIIWKV